jgi:hypothetical protein
MQGGSMLRSRYRSMKHSLSSAEFALTTVYAYSTGSADLGSQFDRDEAGRTRRSFPHQLAWWRRAALQSRKAGYIL